MRFFVTVMAILGFTLSFFAEVEEQVLVWALLLGCGIMEIMLHRSTDRVILMPALLGYGSGCVWALMLSSAVG